MNENGQNFVISSVTVLSRANEPIWNRVWDSNILKIDPIDPLIRESAICSALDVAISRSISLNSSSSSNSKNPIIDSSKLISPLLGNLNISSPSNSSSNDTHLKSSKSSQEHSSKRMQQQSLFNPFDQYLGLLHVIGDIAVYGFHSNSYIKILITLQLFSPELNSKSSNYNSKINNNNNVNANNLGFIPKRSIHLLNSYNKEQEINNNNYGATTERSFSSKSFGSNTSLASTSSPSTTYQKFNNNQMNNIQFNEYDNSRFPYLDKNIISDRRLTNIKDSLIYSILSKIYDSWILYISGNPFYFDVTFPKPSLSIPTSMFSSILLKSNTNVDSNKDKDKDKQPLKELNKFVNSTQSIIKPQILSSTSSISQIYLNNNNSNNTDSITLDNNNILNNNPLSLIGPSTIYINNDYISTLDENSNIFINLNKIILEYSNYQNLQISKLTNKIEGNNNDSKEDIRKNYYYSSIPGFKKFEMIVDELIDKFEFDMAK